jgi:DNA-binding transcriptional regulator YhcF (GntR family)
MGRKHPARDRVSRYITTLLKDSSIIKLPSLREIAHFCSVCPATVCKVITSLQKQHNLVPHWGHEIRLNRNVLDKSVAQKSKAQSKWQRIRDLLVNDFIDCQHKTGTLLPAKKELQHRYNVSWQTLSKALKPLLASGKIEVSGGKLRICNKQVRRQWKPKIVVICAGLEPGLPKVVSEREREFFQYLTIEAAQRHVELEYVIYEDWAADPVFYLISHDACSNLPEDDAVLGYVVSSWHMKSIANCIFRLTPSGKPVAVWVEHPTEIEKLAIKKQMAYFNIGYSKNAGIHVAEHFLKLGHREIAYLSPFHDSLWSKARLSGIIEAFEKQGASCKIHAMLTTSSKSEWDYIEQVMKMPDSVNIPQLKGFTHTLPSFFKARIGNFQNEYVQLFRDSLIMDTIKPHLDNIIQNTAITAVIAANDHCALLALDYLKSRGIGIPSRISIAGFDNSFSALLNGLTSYSFDTYSMVLAMIAHITDNPEKKNLSNRYVFDGNVIDRATTGCIIT